MSNNNAGAVATMADHTSNAVPLGPKGTNLADRFNRSMRKRFCLLSALLSGPPPEPCSAASGTSDEGSRRKSKQSSTPQLFDSKGSVRSSESPPTPSSSRLAGFSSPPHPAQESARGAEGRVGCETADQAPSMLEKTEATNVLVYEDQIQPVLPILPLARPSPSPAASLTRPSPHFSPQNMIPVRPSADYKLVLIQQPTAGAAFEDNLLARIGLAPPLILELQILKNGKREPAFEELPFLICQCSLLDESGSVADMVDWSVSNTTTGTHLAAPTPSTASSSPGRGGPGRRSRPSVPTRSSGSTDHSIGGASESSAAVDTSAPQVAETTVGNPPRQEDPQLVRMLYGTLVAGPQQYNSPQGVRASYFFFPEITIRTTGRFRIKCTLLRLALPSMQATSEPGELASVQTHVFEVIKRQEYSAPYITDISRHFARQGVPLLLPPGISAD